MSETPIIRVKTREIDYDNRASESDTAIDFRNGKSRQTRLRNAESRRGFAIQSSRIKSAFQQAAYESSARCFGLRPMKRPYRVGSTRALRKFKNCRSRPNARIGIAVSFGKRTTCLSQRTSDFVAEFSMRAGLLLTAVPSQRFGESESGIEASSRQLVKTFS